MSIPVIAASSQRKKMCPKNCPNIFFCAVVYEIALFLLMNMLSIIMHMILRNFIEPLKLSPVLMITNVFFCKF